MLDVIRTCNRLRLGLVAALVLNLVLPAVILVCAPSTMGHDAEDVHAKTVDALTGVRAIHSTELVHVQEPSSRTVSFLSCLDPVDDRWECCEVSNIGLDRMLLTRLTNDGTEFLAAKLAVLPLWSPEHTSQVETSHPSDRPSHRSYPHSSARVHLLISSFLL